MLGSSALYCRTIVVEDAGDEQALAYLLYGIRLRR